MATLHWDKSKHVSTFNFIMRFLSKLFSPNFTSYNSDPFNLFIGGRQGGLQVEHNFFVTFHQTISDFLDTTGF